jgi:hypothetical protein
MKKVILHIGRHKSGTSSLQNFLVRNRLLLEQHDYLYPQVGISSVAHHEIANAFSQKNVLNHGAAAILESELIEAFRAELVTTTATSIIVSSEKFTACNPKLMKELFAGYEVEVVIYLRDQLSYLASAYAQIVHADTITESIEDYYETFLSRNIDYWKFIKRWESTFGDNVSVALFDRKALHEGDIIKDFLWRFTSIDIANQSVQALMKDHNPTLGASLLIYKLYLNRYLPHPAVNKQHLYRQFSEMASDKKLSGKFKITQSIASKVIAHCNASNQKVAANYFDGKAVFSAKAEEFPLRQEESLSREQFVYITEILTREVPGFDQLLDEKTRLNGLALTLDSAACKSSSLTH